MGNACVSCMCTKCVCVPMVWPECGLRVRLCVFVSCVCMYVSVLCALSVAMPKYQVIVIRNGVCMCVLCVYCVCECGLIVCVLIECPVCVCMYVYVFCVWQCPSNRL